MALTAYVHSAHYTYIDEALRANWTSYTSLKSEMAAFVPKPKEDFIAAREAEVDRLRALNPTTPVDQLTAFVDQQFSFTTSAQWQFHQRFDQRHMTTYITVVTLAHALCEALINAILAIGLADAGSPELFELLEKADFKQKWLVGPQSFAPEYRFPNGSGMHETLTFLAKQRNSIIHLKIHLEVAGARVLEGSDFQRRPYDEEHRWLRRFFSLPYDLADFTRKSLTKLRPMLLVDRRPIELAAEHVVA